MSDARNDAVLDRALARLPAGSALVFRHYHLDPAARAKRMKGLARLARLYGVAFVLSGVGYGPARHLSRWGKGAGGLRLATAHDMGELAGAARARVDAVLLSPVFPTRSHPGAKGLGPLRFALMARQCPLPVLALGGMDRRRAERLRAYGFAAIDGLSR
ncbi:thiamine monophosphate synthase [Novosphingobium nitrogenifigens DSM 19370]|uniref:Thiamine monophosphate synthase n=1 Tax=Novosphingobium nitrogenifigens DSM 19370 TaxID=983920 RepID=F1ZCM6_9SPHN|nr:thiamine monophosphate synthase [Novosphingobium nitrogenifigens DSM 19370]